MAGGVDREVLGDLAGDLLAVVVGLALGDRAPLLAAHRAEVDPEDHDDPHEQHGRDRVVVRCRGAEERLAREERSPLHQAGDLRSDPHLEMHTRGG